MTADTCAEILGRNGYGSEVEYAARYAYLRAWAICCNLPVPRLAPPCPPLAKLFEAIERCGDAATLEIFAAENMEAA